MMARAGRLLSSRGTTIFAAVFLASTVLGGGMGAAWANETRQPRLNVLGSGNALSVLITAGQARILLATGDDPVAFANALAQVRHPTTPRIDILLVTGRGRSLLVPIAARETVHPRYVASLGAIPPSPERDALQGAMVPVLASPRVIDLGSGIQVEVEIADAGIATDADAEQAWRLIVRHGVTTVVILSRGEDAGRFPDIGPVAALVVAAGTLTTGPEGPAAGALVVPATAIKGKDLRRDLGSLIREKVWTIRSFPGEVTRLEFVPGGLRLPAHATVVEPSPAPGAASISSGLPLMTTDDQRQRDEMLTGGTGTTAETATG